MKKVNLEHSSYKNIDTRSTKPKIFAKDVLLFYLNEMDASLWNFPREKKKAYSINE